MARLLVACKQIAFQTFPTELRWCNHVPRAFCGPVDKPKPCENRSGVPLTTTALDNFPCIDISDPVQKYIGAINIKQRCLKLAHRNV